MSKRMFSANILESDAFLDMPLTSQALYVHLNINADNDGFVNPKRILRMIGAANDDLQILIAKRFLLTFDSGVVVIKHWWINNMKRHDRHVPTTYQKELNELAQTDNKSYSKITTQLQIETASEKPNGNQMATNVQPMVASMQFSAAQSSAVSIQSSAAQPTGNPPATKTIKPELNKFNKNKTLDKKAYARAVRADEALERKEHDARHRKPSSVSTLSASEIFSSKNRGGE